MFSNFHYKHLTFALLPFFITACTPEHQTNPKLSQTSKDINNSIAPLAPYVVNTFNAKYYFEDDGTTAGQGTDGSDLTIVPVLKHTETVKYPAINYIFSNFYNINSYNFYAQWDGSITVNQESNLSANFDISWSDVSFSIDGILVDKWANGNKIIPLDLNVGIHTIHVEYHNHWHTTGFNVSFTDYNQTNKTVHLDVDDTTQIDYIEAYESDNQLSPYNEAEVTLPLDDKKHLLYLTSYNAINWIIKNPYNTEIQGIVFNSNSPGTTITTEDGFVLHVTDLAGYGSDASADIHLMTGRTPDYNLSTYDAGEIEIPSL